MSNWSKGSKYWPSKYATDCILLLFFLLTFRLKDIFSQPLFHLPSVMISVTIMTVTYCSSTEAPVIGNQELLFPYNKKTIISSRKLANTRMGTGGHNRAGKMLQRHRLSYVQLWRVRFDHYLVIIEWELNRHMTWQHLKSPGPDATCGTCEQCWEWCTCPVLPLPSLLHCIMCWRWPSFSPDGNFPFPFCKNFILVSLSKWEGEGRRREHVWYLSYFISTWFGRVGAMKWLHIPHGRIRWKNPCAHCLPQHTPLPQGSLTLLLLAGPAKEIARVFLLKSALHPSPSSRGSGPWGAIVFHSHNGSFLTIMCKESW